MMINIGSRMLVHHQKPDADQLGWEKSFKLSLITHLWVCECRMRGFSSRHQTVAIGNHFWSPIFTRSSSDLWQLVVRLTRIDRRPFTDNQRLSMIASVDKSLVIIRCLYDSRRQSHHTSLTELVIGSYHTQNADNKCVLRWDFFFSLVNYVSTCVLWTTRLSQNTNCIMLAPKRNSI